MSWIVDIVCNGIDISNSDHVNFILWRACVQNRTLEDIDEEYKEFHVEAHGTLDNWCDSKRVLDFMIQGADDFISFYNFVKDNYNEVLPGVEEAFNGPLETELDEQECRNIDLQDSMEDALYRRSTYTKHRHLDSSHRMKTNRRFKC